ncbi:uncharacterized protein [Magallana gigas]|uniref:uncharacterized protein n=1 Tax=Magallana gigas TaxID=29159 RepID=UPI0033400133
MVACFLLLLFFVQTIAEKRILLNDPDLIQTQIHALERKVEDVVAKNTDLSTKYTDLTTKYNDLFAKYNTLLTKTNDGGVFVRWGRKDCPGNNTELVYSGFAGGSWYDHIGAAAEFVCLPRDPDLTSKFTLSYAFMYGSEYGTSDFGHENGDDLPCSVCRSTVHSSVLMIPGKSSCYDGWTMQYHGDLVAGQYQHRAATQYICLDEHPEALTAGQRNDDGKVFVPVKAVCGALACPPYHNDRYLTCAVCTK